MGVRGLKGDKGDGFVATDFCTPNPCADNPQTFCRPYYDRFECYCKSGYKLDTTTNRSK